MTGAGDEVIAFNAGNGQDTLGAGGSGSSGGSDNSRDTLSLGGDLAYQYGKHGTLAHVGIGAAQEILGEAGFGSQAQALKPLDELQAGPKLG
jgi:hypothetical protein